MPGILGNIAPDAVVSIFAALLLAVMAGIALIACYRAKHHMADRWGGGLHGAALHGGSGVRMRHKH